MHAPDATALPVPPANQPPADAGTHWKMISLARRHPALSTPDFAQAWRGHWALLSQCRHVRDKVLAVQQCIRLRSTAADDGGLPGASTEYDGVNLLQVRDLDAAIRIGNDPETLAILGPSELRVFSAPVRDCTLVCAEQVLRDAPPTAVVVFGFLRRNAGVEHAAFASAWSEGHRDAWLSAPVFRHVRRVVHNRIVQTPPPGCNYDGIAEWWFDSADAARAAFTDSRQGSSNGAPDLRSTTRDLRCQLPAPYSVLVDLKQSVFMFTQVMQPQP